VLTSDVASVPDADKPFIIVEHDPSNPPERFADWLIAAGASYVVVKPHQGEPLPTDLSPYAGILMLGGQQVAQRVDEERFPWREASLQMLRTALSQRVPTLAVCLGSQLLAIAGGGAVERGDQGKELGHALVARRDASYQDPLFADLPMTPDVMEFHGDVITALPPDATLLASGAVYQNQAFRVGDRAWGMQFHIETEPETFAAWFEVGRERLEQKGYDVDGMIERAVRYHEEMPEVWAPFVAKFVRIAEQDAQQSGADATAEDGA